MPDRPIALEAYETLAEAYAAAIDTKPHNAYYERPATLSLLPDVAGLRVLDAGCGPGVYSEWLLDHDASVLAFDASPRMVRLAADRLAGRCEVLCADLSRPLSFLRDAQFDLVLSTLVLEYVEDWRTALAELRRVLRPGGTLVVSVTHPFGDWLYFKTDRYFETEPVAARWKGFGSEPVDMPSFRRSLQETLNPFLESGFRIDRIVEPLPTDAFRQADPVHFEQLIRLPAFLCVRAIRSSSTTS